MALRRPRISEPNAKAASEDRRSSTLLVSIVISGAASCSRPGMLCLKDQKFMKMYPDGNLLQSAPLLWRCCGYRCANDAHRELSHRKVAHQCALAALGIEGWALL